MKKLFFTLGAVLTFGMASAQINGQNTAGQINNNNNTVNATQQDMRLSRDANTQPQSVTVPSSNSIATPSAGPGTSGMGTSGMSGTGSQATQTSGGSGSGSGSTVNTTGTPNTTNTTNATTTGKPKQ